MARQCATVPVVSGNRPVGLLTLENISEMVMVNTARNTPGRPPVLEGSLGRNQPGHAS